MDFYGFFLAIGKESFLIERSLVIYEIFYANPMHEFINRYLA